MFSFLALIFAVAIEVLLCWLY